MEKNFFIDKLQTVCLTDKSAVKFLTVSNTFFTKDNIDDFIKLLNEDFCNKDYCKLCRCYVSLSSDCKIELKLHILFDYILLLLIEKDLIK